MKLVDWTLQPAAGGAFVAQYVATAAGEYEVVVTLRGEPLPQRPTVTVLPAKTAARCCVARGNGLSEAVAGERVELPVRRAGGVEISTADIAQRAIPANPPRFSSTLPDSVPRRSRRRTSSTYSVVA